MNRIAEFLSARIGEDEAAALREVKAKREILAAHDRPEHRCPLPVLAGPTGQLWTPDEGPCWTLRLLAAIYSDHPDYPSVSLPVPQDPATTPEEHDR